MNPGMDRTRQEIVFLVTQFPVFYAGGGGGPGARSATQSFDYSGFRDHAGNGNGASYAQEQQHHHQLPPGLAPADDEPTAVLHSLRGELLALWADPAVRACLKRRKVRLEEMPGL